MRNNQPSKNWKTAMLPISLSLLLLIAFYFLTFGKPVQSDYTPVDPPATSSNWQVE